MSADADGLRKEAAAVLGAYGGLGSRRLTGGGDSAATGPLWGRILSISLKIIQKPDATLFDLCVSLFVLIPMLTMMLPK